VTPTKPVQGEELHVPERVILAPAVGVFRPTPDDASAREGHPVTEGDVVGVVESRGCAHPVRSAFTGFLMGMLAHPGERVREGQPVAWLRVG
jgi:biotin carboxyl carrier protein